MLKVEKRDACEVDFNLKKIKEAIRKTFEAAKKVYTEDILELLSLRVSSDFQPKIKDNKINIEDIQDSVEKVLEQAGYTEVAKSYILYRKQREKLREMKSTMIDYKNIVNNYVKVEDWRVKENSTVTYSVGGLILHNSGAVTANYWLSEVYDEQIANAHREGDFHIHDLSMLTAYCAGWSLRQLIEEGLGGVPGKITSAPASHLNTLCNQMVNFLGIMQNEWAGAQAFSSFDTYLAPFVKIDNLTYKEAKQAIQSFVFGVNTPSRWGTQSPFSNITLDWVVPEDLSEEYAIVGGKKQDFKYKDCQKEMDIINKAFLEIMLEGDANGRGFQYPIPTYNITKDFVWDNENAQLLFEMTAKYGTPYFQNFINSDLKPGDVRSMAILGSQDVIYINDKGRIAKNEIRHIVNNWIKSNGKKPEYKILYNGKFIDIIDMFEVPYHEYPKYVKIKLENNYLQNFSYQHKCPIVRDGEYLEVESQELKINDMFILSKEAYQGNDIGSFESGKILGYFLGNGWINTHSKSEINIVANINKKYITEDIYKYFTNIACEVKMEEQRDVNIYKCYIYGKQAVSFIEQYISGKTAKTKKLTNKIWNTSVEFRKGIINGLLETDGYEKENILFHTTNKEIIDDIIVLANSVGMILNYRKNDKNTRYFNKDKSDKEIFTSYELKIKDIENFEKFKFKDNNEFVLVPIKDIEFIDSNSDTVYNFTVNTDEHLYELPNGIITHQCCRLQLDKRELMKKTGGLFGSGEKTGSVGVVTINLPRIAYNSKTEEDFFKKLAYLMDIAKRSLEIKRKVSTKLLEEGLYPYSKRYLGNFDGHFSTIGLVGMNETCLNANWINKELFHKDAIEFSERILDFMRNRLSDYQVETGNLYNLEATPAESTSYRLAKMDKNKFFNIKTAGAGTNVPYYTNSCHLPVSFSDDIFEALDIQDRLQTKFTGGTVFHTFLGERIRDWETTASLVKKIAYNYHLPYYTLSPTYSICHKHGYIKGEEYTCPECGEETEVYSRITGYYRPIKHWNDGKVSEFKERTEYCIEKSEVKTYDGEEKRILFTTNSCPNCPAAKEELKDVENIEILDAHENTDLAVKFGIRSVPALIVVKGDKHFTYAGISDIRRFKNEYDKQDA